MYAPHLVPTTRVASHPGVPFSSEMAQAIARGRELTKQARWLGEAADRQIEGVQATIKQAECVLDRSQQLLSDTRQPFIWARPPCSTAWRWKSSAHSGVEP